MRFMLTAAQVYLKPIAILLFGCCLSGPLLAVSPSEAASSCVASFAPGIEMLPLSQLQINRPQEFQAALAGVVDLANKLYVEAERRGEEGIFPIRGQDLVRWVQIDSRVGLNQILMNDDKQVIGFAIAVISGPDSVMLEKLGVAEEYQGQRLSRALLHAVAQRTAQIGIPHVQLLVRKGNAKAQAIYEHYGFRNVSPPNSGGNAYGFEARTADLLARTRP